MDFTQFVASRRARDVTIMQMRKKKIGVKEIGLRFNISKQRVSAIIKRIKNGKLKAGK